MTPARRLAALSVVALLLVPACARLRVEPVQRFRAASADAVRGGRLVVGIEAPLSIDPAQVADDGGRLVSSLVCEPLVQLDPVTGQLAHGIVKTVIPAGKGAAFTLALRDDVRFHDGSRLTAQDVAYSLSRIARHEVAAAEADVLAPILGYGVLHAPPSPTSDRDPADQLLAGVRPIGKDALQLTLGERNAGFVRALSLPLAAPVPRRKPDRDPGFSDKPVCAGPYELVRPYRYGDHTIELRRFKDYYGANDGFVARGRGFVDTIEFRLMPKAEQLKELRAGRLDVAQLDRPAADVPGSLVTGPVPEVDFVGTAASSGPLADPRVRRVLSRSLDRRRLVSEVFGDGRLPADRLLPPGTSQEPSPESCRDAIPVVGATPTMVERALVAPLLRTGIPLTVNDDFANARLARAVAAQWQKALGIKVTVTAEGWEHYQSQLTGPGGLPGLFRTSWRATYPAEDPVLFPLFESHSQAQDNVARYRNRDLDRLLARSARTAVDDRLRAKKYAAAEELVCRDLPLIPLTFGQAEYAMADRVASAGPTAVDVSNGLPLLREIYVRRTS